MGGFTAPAPSICRSTPWLPYDEWQGFDYRAFVTHGDDYVEDNFDRYAGTWKPGALGQPLHVLVLDNAEPSIGFGQSIPKKPPTFPGQKGALEPGYARSDKKITSVRP